MVVDVDGARLKLDAWGEGPPVVCLHAGVADRRMWSRQDPSRWGRRLVAYDRRGFGETEATDRPWSPVADALAVADAVGAARPVWMGCSQGGRVALDLALAHPDRVQALVLVAPAVSGAPDDDEGVDPALLARYEALEAGDDRAALARFETRVWLDGHQGPEGRVGGPVRELAFDMVRRHHALPAPGAARYAADTWARLEEVAVPVVLVWGTLDLPPLVRRFERMTRRLPRVTGIVLSGTAHLPNLEDPARFDALVPAALRSLSA